MTTLRNLAKIVTIFLFITFSAAIGNQLNAQDGKALFSANCASCHAVNKKLTGPALAGVEDRWPDKQNLYAWIKNSAAFLKTGDPYATNLYNEYNKVAMNNFPGLSDADIDANHTSAGLNSKLKVALRYLPKLGIKGVLQGDMMFAKGDIDEKVIDGQSYITFQPNTIVYAVPSDAKLARMMLSAQMGIVFHTSYTGKTMADMKASFNIDIGHLTTTKDVWFRDASFTDASGTATFTAEETSTITSTLSQAGRTFQSINALNLNRISASETIMTYIKTFNNTKVRAGQAIKDTRAHTFELTRWVEAKLNKDISDAKKADTKKKRIKEKTEIMRFFNNAAKDLKAIFDLMNLLVTAKNMIVKKLQQMKQVTNTFLRTDDGFKITNPEGFVAVDRLKGNAVKLIDRLEFAHANFNATKNWSN